MQCLIKLITFFFELYVSIILLLRHFIGRVRVQEAMQCVEELEQATMLYVFVRVGVESTLERSQITRDHMGQLFHQLLQAGSLSKFQFFKGWVSFPYNTVQSNCTSP